MHVAHKFIAFLVMEQPTEDQNKLTQSIVADDKQEHTKVERILRHHKKETAECYSSANNDTNGSDENDDQAEHFLSSQFLNETKLNSQSSIGVHII